MYSRAETEYSSIMDLSFNNNIYIHTQQLENN
jgi:hypothetical protein